MRKTNLLILTIGLTIIFAQTILAQTEKQIATIRKDVNLINKNAKNYTKTTKNVDGISLEGTEATYYISGRELKKITARMYGETYNASAELYYSGEEPIFIFFKMNRYDTQIGLEKPPKVVKTEEQRFYFAGGDVIRLLVGKKRVEKSDARFSELKDEIIKLSDELKGAYFLKVRFGQFDLPDLVHLVADQIV